MLCTNCGKNPATVHIRRTVNGITKEYMLCPECAGKSEFSPSFTDFDSLLKSAFSFMPGSYKRRKACPSCGSTLSSISDSGKVGCAKCYEVFAEELAPAIARIHANAVYVTNDTLPPKKEEKKENRLDALKAQLARAVESEDYELAAKLRDEIRALEGN